MQVAFRSLHEIEQEAQSLLAEFARSKGWSPAPPVPIEKLINYLGLHQEILDLYDFLGVEKDEEGDLLGALSFGRRTVYVHSGLDPDNQPHLEGRFHFTLSHEIGHWVLHRDEFIAKVQQLPLLDGVSAPEIVCRGSEASQRIEIQANQFASYLLLPRDLVTDFWGSKVGAVDTLTPAIIDRAVRGVADRFRASNQATRIRLGALGLLTPKKQRVLNI